MNRQRIAKTGFRGSPDARGWEGVRYHAADLPEIMDSLEMLNRMTLAVVEKGGAFVAADVAALRQMHDEHTDWLRKKLELVLECAREAGVACYQGATP